MQCGGKISAKDDTKILPVQPSGAPKMTRYDPFPGSCIYKSVHLVEIHIQVPCHTSHETVKKILHPLPGIVKADTGMPHPTS